MYSYALFLEIPMMLHISDGVSTIGRSSGFVTRILPFFMLLPPFLLLLCSEENERCKEAHYPINLQISYFMNNVNFSKYAPFSFGLVPCPLYILSIAQRSNINKLHITFTRYLCNIFLYDAFLIFYMIYLISFCNPYFYKMKPYPVWVRFLFIHLLPFSFPSDK